MSARNLDHARVKSTSLQRFQAIDEKQPKLAKRNLVSCGSAVPSATRVALFRVLGVVRMMPMVVVVVVVVVG